MDKIQTYEDMVILEDILRRLSAKHLTKTFVVEKDFLARKLIQGQLAPRGATNLVVLESGKKLLGLLGQLGSRNAVVFYELETADLNGLEFIQAAKQKVAGAGKLKIVLSMAKAPTNEAKEKLLQMGVVAVLAKPIDAAKLAESLDKIGYPAAPKAQ